MANMPTPDTDPESITLESLEARMYALGMEAMSLDGSKELAARWFDGFRGFLKDTHVYLSRRLSVILSKPTTVHDNKILRAVKATNYVNLSQMEISCLAGFSGTAVDYANVLNEAATISSNIEKDLLRHVNVTIGRFINQPDELANASASGLLDYKSNSGELREKMTEFIGGDTTVVRKKFGLIYERMSDISTVTTLLNEANAKQHATSSKNMVRLVADLSKRVEQLNKLINHRNGAGQAMSPNMANLLSTLIFTAAKEVEFYSIVGFNLESFSVSTQRGFDEIVDMVK